MCDFRFLIAAALLTSPTEDIGPDTAALYEPLAPAVRQLAVDWELLDPRELDHVLASAQDFDFDLKLLRERYRELSTAPLVSESLRLPARAQVNDLLNFNRSYRQDLTGRLELDVLHQEELLAAAQETDQLYRLWNLVRDARCPCYYVTVRRQAMQQLRDALGAQAFYTGNLPPAVPVWRLPR